MNITRPTIVDWRTQKRSYEHNMHNIRLGDPYGVQIKSYYFTLATTDVLSEDRGNGRTKFINFSLNIYLMYNKRNNVTAGYNIILLVFGLRSNNDDHYSRCVGFQPLHLAVIIKKITNYIIILFCS